MTAETLASICGVILSLVCAYIPGIEEQYNGLESKQKAMVMGLLLVLVSAAIFGLGCGGIIALGIPCNQQGAIELAQILIAALIANQSTYLLAVRPGQRHMVDEV